MGGEVSVGWEMVTQATVTWVGVKTVEQSCKHSPSGLVFLLMEGGRVEVKSHPSCSKCWNPIHVEVAPTASLSGLKIPIGWMHWRLKYVVWEGRPSGTARPHMFYADIKHLSFDAQEGCARKCSVLWGHPKEPRGWNPWIPHN